MKSIFVVLTLLLLTSAACADELSDALSADRVNQELLDELERAGDGEVRIIIKLKDEETLAGKLAAVAASDRSAVGKRTETLDVMRKSYARVQSGVLSRLDEDDLVIQARYQIVNAIAANASRESILKLLEDPRVEHIAYDSVVHAYMDESAPLINASEAWSKQYLGRTFTGLGEAVCILDTGIRYTHDYLGDGWGNKVLGGYDYVNGDSNPNDDNWHGTHCAGTVASTHSTWKGVAPDANLVAVKVLNSGGSGQWSWIISGIQYCTTNKDTYGVSVISMSLGGSNYGSNCDSAYPALRDAIDAAYNAGIFVVAASGNDGSTSSIGMPSCMSNCVSVGATHDANLGREPDSGTYDCGCYDASATEDLVACFSNRDNILDLWAPGNYITSTYASSDTAFAHAYGTSMACPHVAGAAAVIAQFYKDRYGVPATPAQIKNALVDTGKSVTRDVTKPRIDLWAALLNFTNTAPSFAGGNVSPTEQLDTATFYFNVTWTDAENNTPDTPVVTVNGTEYDLTESDSSDGDRTDGKGYYYAATLTRGDYEFNFTAGDGFLNASTTVQSNVLVTVKPNLYSVAVTPTMGEENRLFNFTVNYTDLDGDAPTYLNVSLDGVTYIMLEADGADTDMANGKIYYMNRTGLSPGTHTYHALARDNRTYDTSLTSSATSGPRVNTTADCTGDLPPGVGNSSAWDVTQATTCGDSAFIPSSAGMTIIQHTLSLFNATVYQQTRILNITGGRINLDNATIEFID